jgi:alkylhydroperoxidase/carboxymuconolactone decarboxylase family protein YurZ
LEASEEASVEAGVEMTSKIDMEAGPVNEEAAIEVEVAGTTAMEAITEVTMEEILEAIDIIITEAGKPRVVTCLMLYTC